MWYIYTREYYSAIKKNELMLFTATWMDLDSVMLSEVRQRVRNIIRHPLYVKCNKKWYKTETHRLKKWTYGCWGEGIVREVGKVIYTLLYLKWITNKDLLYSIWNSAQYYDQNNLDERWVMGEKGYMYMYVWVPSLFTWNYHSIVNWLYCNRK